ncbi:sulfite exporter TauE/SafE family protein [Clostridioides sp. ES-S-0010-02]|uniref:sulfite exporter TauE/SafE family protein n=1 Tax=Clostridioides sp. ES-S-0010-02 TaxID=2770776 RepID=UPI001D1277B3|nr:sulfite exporter TauE/SafE family protein [Clostridioides sp. ES-S-0010-02]
MNVILFAIAVLSTTIGAITGIGGGVIIKPVLDLIGIFDVSTISVLSSFTVLSMAIVSVYKQIKSKLFKINFRLILIGVASVLGGTIGQRLLDLSISYVNNPSIIKITQNIMMIILLVMVYLYRDKSLNVKFNTNITYFIVGIFLGVTSSFLGIGGGPINVAVFTILFGLSAKEAAFNSIITILFSNISKLVTVFINTGFGIYDLSGLPFMIIGAVLGGIIGSSISKNMDDKRVKYMLSYMTIIITGINIYSIFQVIYFMN